ncbi:MAG: PRTRC system protein E [Acidobacteriaceae bacterium]
MFKELVPILRHRAVLMTLTLVDEDQVRVNIIPKKIKDGENDALTTPLSMTGTAEELDAELSSTLVGFVGSHLQLKNTLEKAKAEMDAAAKAAQAEARAKSKIPSKKEPEKNTGTKAVEPAKASEPAKAAPPKTASLFDMPTAEPPVVQSPVADSKAQSSDEEEVLDEIQEDGTDQDEDLDEAA